jgi:hypothetical protein
MKMIDRLRPEEAFPRLGVWGRAVLGRAGGSGGRLLRGLRTHQGNHPPEHLIDSLAEEGLFASLKRKDLLTVVRLGELLSFEPGEKILSEGDRGLALYLISIGEVKMMRKGASPPQSWTEGIPSGRCPRRVVSHGPPRLRRQGWRSVSPSPDGRSKPSFTSSPRFKNGKVGAE